MLPLMFSYVSLDERVPADHRVRALPRITDQALNLLSPRFGAMYVNFGRPSIPARAPAACVAAAGALYRVNTLEARPWRAA